MRMYRQGDVLVVSVNRIPTDALVLPPEDGRVVLAHGEVTGHAHALAPVGAELLASEEGRFLRVSGDEPVALMHDEHDTILLPPGEYQIVRQREYTPGAFRQVAD